MSNIFWVLAYVDESLNPPIYYLKYDLMETTRDACEAKKFECEEDARKFREDNIDWLDVFKVVEIDL